MSECASRDLLAGEQSYSESATDLTKAGFVGLTYPDLSSSHNADRGPGAPIELEDVNLGAFSFYLKLLDSGNMPRAERPSNEKVRGDTFAQLVSELCIPNIRKGGVNVLFIVQQPGTEVVADQLDRLAKYIADNAISLVCLAIENSLELADSLTVELSLLKLKASASVVCWMNDFSTARQWDFAFQFCYHVLREYLVHLERETPEQIVAEGAGTYRSTLARSVFKRSLAYFERKLGPDGHLYTLSMNGHGEPCLLPDLPARPQTVWTYQMYEKNLGRSAKLCSEEFGSLYEALSRPQCLWQTWESRRARLLYRIGSYFGWLVLARFSTDHNRLTRKKVIYDVEHSFSGEGLTVARLRATLDTQLKEGKVGLWEYSEEGGVVKANSFQLYKMDQLAIGEVMSRLHDTCVVTRFKFNQLMDKPESIFHRFNAFDKLKKEIDKLAEAVKSGNQDDLRNWLLRIHWIRNSFEAMHQELLQSQPDLPSAATSGPNSQLKGDQESLRLVSCGTALAGLLPSMFRTFLPDLTWLATAVERHAWPFLRLALPNAVLGFHITSLAISLCDGWCTSRGWCGPVQRNANGGRAITAFSWLPGAQ